MTNTYTPVTQRPYQRFLPTMRRVLKAPTAPLAARIPVFLVNGGQGGTNGTTVTSANSGGESGNAWDSVSIAGGGTLTYDNTVSIHGALSYKNVMGATLASNDLLWTTSLTPQGQEQPQVWARCYFNLPANPSGTLHLINVRNGTPSCGIVSVNSSGNVVISDAGGTVRGTSTNTVPLNTWFRLECFMICGNVGGFLQAKLFISNPDNVTPDETVTSAANLNTLSAAARIDFSNPQSVASYTFWYSWMAVSNQGYIGPVAPYSIGTAPMRQSVRTMPVLQSLVRREHTGIGPYLGVSQPPIPPTAVHDQRLWPRLRKATADQGWLAGVSQPPLNPSAVRDTRRDPRPLLRAVAGSWERGISQPPIPPAGLARPSKPRLSRRATEAAPVAPQYIPPKATQAEQNPPSRIRLWSWLPKWTRRGRTSTPPAPTSSPPPPPIGRAHWWAVPDHARWEAGATHARWRIDMPGTFDPIAAVSVEQIPVVWTSELAGTTVDPTGNTAGQPQLQVNFSFPVSSGNPLAPAEPSGWYQGEWLTTATVPGYVAVCIVGPVNGVVTLTAGQKYDVWSQIIGNPEQPAKYAGTITVY